MDISFWEARWKEGRIGFHEGRPNVLLERQVSRLQGQQRILVPLCGKTEDLAFLAARGHSVVGVEAVEEAVKAFFEEHRLNPTVTTVDSFRVYHAGAITLLAGDFFATSPTNVGQVDGFYDRAALIALPPAQRARYVQHLRGLMPGGGTGLVVTFEYPEEAMEGPPFPVGEPELRSHYAGWQVEPLEARPSSNPRLSALGVDGRECIYFVRP